MSPDQLPLSNSLQFDEALSWRAGRPIPLADLTKRLQKLTKELRELSQDDFDRESILTAAKDLAAQNLLAHKDKGVRAYTACCLTDVLRVCAPNAPYNPTQLKDIFSLFVGTVFPALTDPASAYHTQHLYVLRSLAEVKSVILLAEIPGNETLVKNMFASFFDTMSDSSKTEQLGKSVEFNMTTILVTLVEESLVLPPEVIDVVVAQFLRVDPRVLQDEDGRRGKGKKDRPEDGQTTLRLKELPAAYSMAKNLCNTCPDRMARHFSQYFNEVMVTDPVVKAGRHQSVDEDDGAPTSTGLTEEDYGDLMKVHRLLRELWRACPSVLVSVIPQVEVELSAENVRIRLLAIQTIGDMIAGIGAAGPPSTPRLDPASYPQAQLSAPPPERAVDILRDPSSPQPFSQTHSEAYRSFLGRKADKSPVVRSTWTTCIGRIITTSAGGVGLTEVQERELIRELSDKLVDPDERVRIAAIQAMDAFSFRDVVLKLGILGGVDTEGSALQNLADRASDKKHTVRTEAMQTLGRLWGVASGEIAAQSGLVIDLLGNIPSKIFDGFYKNDKEVNLLIDHVLHEMLLPSSYPPIKAKKAGGAAGGDYEEGQEDPDELRTQRILVLISGLDERSLKAFLALLARQSQVARVVSTFVQLAERYNGGTVESIEGRGSTNEIDIRKQLSKQVDWFSAQLPEPLKASAELWKLIKLNDRRLYRLIMWCISSDSDHKLVRGSLREIIKRLQGTPSTASTLDTLVPILYRSSYLIFNKSHVPAAVQYSQTDKKQLAPFAQDLLKDMSTHAPAVFKGYVKELCAIIEQQAPTAQQATGPGMVDHLKALAGFARKYPEQLPQTNRFSDSLIAFALHGTPAAVGKQATTILMTVSDKKRAHADELIDVCVNEFDYEKANTLVRLTTLAQLCLTAHEAVTAQADLIAEIAIKQILMERRTRAEDVSEKWTTDEKLDKEILAKELALRILTNRVRSAPDQREARRLVPPVNVLLSHLIEHEGQLPNQDPLPKLHAARLRLSAGKMILKLCATSFAASESDSSTPDHSRVLDNLFTAPNFNSLCLTILDPFFSVRQRFVKCIQKGLARPSDPLPLRFYALPYLLAWEPELSLRKEVQTWSTSRARHFASSHDTTPEKTFLRLLSLLAHHPDFETLKDAVEEPPIILDFARYITYYLQSVATEENIGMIFWIAGRVKGLRDAVDHEPEKQRIASEKLWALCDLAQAVIRKWEELHKWQMLAWPGKVAMPSSLFGNIEGGLEKKVEITSKVWCPQPALNGVEDYVRREMGKPPQAGERGKKRKSTGADDREGGIDTEKKLRKDREMTLPVRATAQKPRAKRSYSTKGDSRPRPKAAEKVSAEDRKATRKSSRAPSGRVSYRELDESEMDELEDEDDKRETEHNMMNDGSSAAEAVPEAEDEDTRLETRSTKLNGHSSLLANKDPFDISADEGTKQTTSPEVAAAAPKGHGKGRATANGKPKEQIFTTRSTRSTRT